MEIHLDHEDDIQALHICILFTSKQGGNSCPIFFMVSHVLETLETRAALNTEIKFEKRGRKMNDKANVAAGVPD